jgi:D-alanyl-D-alanine carboxypeptidase
MSSGLHNYSDDLPFNELLNSERQKVWQPEELVVLGLAGAPYFAPAEGFHYSNTNTILIALIVEQLTGQALADVFAERIFTPLGLTEVVFPAIEDASIPDPHPTGYMFGTNVSTLKMAVLSDADQKAALAGTLLPNAYTDLNPSWGWAAGAVSASAGQLADYVEALVGGGLLEPAIQEERLASLKQPLRPLRILKPVASGIQIQNGIDPNTPWILDTSHRHYRLPASTSAGGLSPYHHNH